MPPTADSGALRRDHHRRQRPLGARPWHARGGGSRAGADTVKARLRDAAELGIEELTVYSFSTENWSRPAAEVQGLMAMFSSESPAKPRSCTRKGCGCASSAAARVSPSSSWSRWTRRKPDRANDAITLFVAFNYGGRAEILDAARALQGSTEEEFRQCLYAPDMHDPELIIRTSGEQRLSNFLLWQAAYSEFIFRDELWPDFTRAALEESLAEFSERRRRYGGR